MLPSTIAARKCTHYNTHFRGQRPQNLVIRMGSSTHATNGTLVKVKRIVQHEKFNYNTIDYDFSLLELANNTEFDRTKRNISLPHQDQNVPDNTSSLVSGWGTTGVCEFVSSQLIETHCVLMGIYYYRARLNLEPIFVRQ